MSVAKKILPWRVRSYIRRKRKHWDHERQFHSRINSIDPAQYLDLSSKPDLNIILLVVDSLRDSRLSCRGYFRETTPYLDSWETKFSAISAAPWTYPSVASIMTGLYPHNHGAVLSGKVKVIWTPGTYLKLRDDVLTLSEMLFLLKYRTYYSSAISCADDALGPRVVPRAFDPSSRADELLGDLRKWIRKGKREKFFAYVQLGDLHMPLNPPEEFRHFFGRVKYLPKIEDWDYFTHEKQKADPVGFREYKENRELIYDNSLRYVDSAIERFCGYLKEERLYESTVLVVTADHGDQFWEHAEMDASSVYILNDVCGVSHGDNVFNETIKVPLLVSGPVPRVDNPPLVSTVDIVPTVLDLLGVNHTMRFDGVNIFKSKANRQLLSEATSCGHEKKALTVGRYKLIYSQDDSIQWLFDLERDPLEQRPIVDKEVTSVFVTKLHQMLRKGEQERIRDVAGRIKSRKTPVSGPDNRG